MNFFAEVDYKSADEAIKQLQEVFPKTQCIHLKNYTFDMEPADFYTKLGEELGTFYPIDEDKTTGDYTGNRWIDISFDPVEPNKYRSSNTRQPFHTDEAYVELPGVEGLQTYFYCEAKADMGGATTVLSSAQIIDALTIDGDTQLLEDIQRVPIKFSKVSTSKTRPILTKDEIDYIWTWNWHRVDASNTTEALDVAQRFHTFLEERVLMAGIAKGVILERGEALFFHDHRILHGRNAFFTNKLGGRRLVKGGLIL